MKDYLNKVICGDCLEIMKSIPDGSIDLVLTDPPYFLDKLDNNWEYNEVENTRNQQIVKSLPAGMKFDIVQDQSRFIMASVHSLEEDLVLGAILVARRNRHDLEFGIVPCRVDQCLGRDFRRP